MGRWLKLIALVLLGVWVPATLHCGLAAMLDPAASPCCHDAAGAAPSTPDKSDADNCRTVEDGDYQSIAAPLKVSAPALMVAPEWLAPRALVLAGTENPEIPRPNTAPPELIPSWRFKLRVVQPARAPSRAIS